MEFVSAGVTGGVEHLLQHWEEGEYSCAQCQLCLYTSGDKWEGPCPWPSFRKAAPRPVSATSLELKELLATIATADSTSLVVPPAVLLRAADRLEELVQGRDAAARLGMVHGAGISTIPCEEYNGYTCRVLEVYCSQCDLFVGHAFEDAKAKGDTSAECTGWRH